MRILQINTVYKVGSTGKIVYEIHNQLQNTGHGSFVIYGRGKTQPEENVFKISSEREGKLQALYGRITGDFYGGAYYSTYKLIKKIKTISPDIVHIHLMNGNYVNNYCILTFLAENNYKTIITLHAETNYTGLCGHSFDCNKWLTGCGKCPQVFNKYNSWFFDRTSSEWRKKAEAYSKFDNLIIVSVSSWLEERVKKSPMFKGRLFYVVGNGLDTSIFHYVESDSLKRKLGIVNEKIILHVTPSFKEITKGGKYVIEVAQKLVLDNVKVVIVGFDGFAGKLPSNVITINHTKSQDEMAQYYSMADVTMITSIRETFSMVCAESLSCGTPVIGFKAGAPEQISLDKYSDFVDQGDIKSLTNVAKYWINNPVDTYLIQHEASIRYSKQHMVEGYINLYNQLYR